MARQQDIAKARVQVNVMRIAGGWARSLPEYADKTQIWSKAALASSGGGMVSVVLADDAFMRDLNHTYRGKNKATNVLSFPGEGEEIGDIVLAYETIREEAQTQGKSFIQHVAHLVVHGCLHLLGHDHENDRDATRMEALEARILRTLGFPNPYNEPA